MNRLSDEQTPHLPVMVGEVCLLFKPLQIKFSCDATVGAGGHSKAILEEHTEILHHYAIDRDPYAIEIANHRLNRWSEKVSCLLGNFSDMKKLLPKNRLFDAILIDLGVSSMQIDTPERGFSLRFDGPLDMRMSPHEQTLTAEQIVNEWSYEELVKLFFGYGEEPQAKKAAYFIVRARQKNPIKSCNQLVDLLAPLGYGSPRRKTLPPTTRIFQALRIAVNDELNALKEVLSQAFELLNVGGRLAIISFHSLEDRLVKQFFAFQCSDKEQSRGLNSLFIDKKPQARLLSKKPIVAGEQEVAINPRARCAKLRACEKIL